MLGISGCSRAVDNDSCWEMRDTLWQKLQGSLFQRGLSDSLLFGKAAKSNGAWMRVESWREQDWKLPTNLSVFFFFLWWETPSNNGRGITGSTRNLYCLKFLMCTFISCLSINSTFKSTPTFSSSLKTSDFYWPFPILVLRKCLNKERR